ncbi:MAG: DUF3347 domain-containing protein [Chitinophagaceae bacterium]|nr:DUF3347 domain-containing protein [Chitinophagaceae bacterium]
MKLLFIGVAVASAISFSACNSNADKTTDHSAMQHNLDTMKDMPMHSSTTSNAATTSKFSEVFSHYQHLTFALANDDSKEAANGAKAMGEAIAKVDKSGFTADQQKGYADLEADMKEHTEHITANANNIAHQREHLETLSKDVYDLTKSFGAGKPLYKIYCPMYNDNKGAYWLAESKEVKNPYFGNKMLTCGEVQEELK